LRWSPQRKALVVKAVGLGAISGDEACRRYRLSPEELRGWQRAAELHGIAGLSVTRMQLLRGDPVKRAPGNRAAASVAAAGGPTASAAAWRRTS
jgi:transposase-like protein